ncbi:tRNA lysidine(34) synthetase TilS [Brevibacterium litoralis]|uniref:tRNA lysidine(34) synthetase TilS n=1 Tax=Brevibacterium litoralis TaxID=3138935 RepID=UPI0032EF5429
MNGPDSRRPRLDRATADIRRAVRAALLDDPGDARYVVGVSGGADSLALAAACAFLQRGGVPGDGRRRAHSGGVPGTGRRQAQRTGAARFVAVTVDHGMQAGSEAVARRVGEVLEPLGLDHRVVPVTVDPQDPAGPEAAARNARYRALVAVAREVGARTVLLAHTLDDQAETVLLGLARGAGVRSLAGMAPRRPAEVDGGTGAAPGGSVDLVRPLLGLRREDTRASCTAQGLDVWDDPMNDDPTYARVRVRNTVLPTLEAELGPGIAQALARTADQAAADSVYLETEAVREWHALESELRRPSELQCSSEAQHPSELQGASAAGEGDVLLVPAGTARLPEALRWRIVRDRLRLCVGTAEEVGHGHVRAVDDLLVGARDGAVSVPGGARVRRRDDGGLLYHRVSGGRDARVRAE